VKQRPAFIIKETNIYPLQRDAVGGKIKGEKLANKNGEN